MKTKKRPTLVLLAAACLCLFEIHPAAAGDAPTFASGTFFIVDVSNVLERFNVAAPGKRLGSVPITGLALSDDIIGIDFRPATGQLYGLGRMNRIYVINALTGAASPIGAAFAPALDNAFFGFDFDPSTDRIRVVSSTGQNLRLNPDTGQMVAVDATINPVSSIEACAYSNNVAGATTTTLYGIDPGTDKLVIQNPPNSGTVTPVGPLGVDIGANSGFDIAPGSNTAYAVFYPGFPPSNLYTINLATGAATLVGALGGGAVARGLALVAGPETVFGVTTSNKLVSFRSNTPGSILSKRSITGLQIGENVLGIDFRPATGDLYGLGSTSRLYRIDPRNAVATQVSAGTFSTPLSGADFGFDFNPTVDRVRVVSDAEQNLSVNPDTAAVTVNTALNPAGNVVAAAYTNNFAGAVSTTLYDIDSASDLLLYQNPPSSGTLSAVGPLGVDASGLTGLDVAPGGAAYASITPPGGVSTNFYTLNLATGAATLVGTIGGGEVIRDTAIRIDTEIAYAVTLQAGPAHNLIRFNPATPGIVVSSVAMTGLQAGETILGIDFRPASGQLFALGSTSRLYRLDRTTGAATQVGAGPFATPLNGTSFGFDFNPSIDRIRVVSDTEQNLSINPDTAAVTIQSSLNPAGNVVAAAYSNNFAGAVSTTLYDVDSLSDELKTQVTPASGTLGSVGPLGVDIGSVASFDIASLSGNAFLAAYAPAAVNPSLFKVDLATGAATLIASINTTDTLVGLSIEIDTDVDLIFADAFE